MSRHAHAEMSAEELASALGRERQAAEVRRADELARTRAQAAHERARADVAVGSRLEELARAEREASAKADAELARMYRAALTSGERIRVSAGLSQSAEARALRLERLRTLNLKVLVPVLGGFAAWSTTGVQGGAARLMAIGSDEAMWWALWLLEPVLIGAVAWVIIARARLAASGGRLAEAAEWIAVACLGTSVILNVISAFPGEGGPIGWAVVGAIIAHAIGPFGAAGTAHLIGVIDASIAHADPWHDERGERVPRLAEMDLRPPVSPALDAAHGNTSPAVSQSTPERPPLAWPISADGRELLPIIARSAPASARARGTARNGAGQGGSATLRAPRPVRPAARPNKGAALPPVLKGVPARSVTDEELTQRLAALMDADALAESASIRQVATALGIGFERAKRVRAALAATASEHGEEVAA
ncbi:hypothetical protein [Streptosporangium sandarakinum]|uniref:hypothetical protein n=1 Tax=Streptosporangium sandarakinum TaxID=1260955 RepID=UPI003723F2AD